MHALPSIAALSVLIALTASLRVHAQIAVDTSPASTPAGSTTPSPSARATTEPPLRILYVPPDPEAPQNSAAVVRGVLLISGITTYLCGYVPSLVMILQVATATAAARRGLTEREGRFMALLAIPMAGPLVAQLALPQYEFIAGIMAAQAGLQILGIGLATAGIIVGPRHANTPSRARAHWSLTPGAPGADAGLSLIVTHL